MSRARDIIEEIAEVRKRRGFGSAMSELPLRLLTLERAFREHDRSNEELTRYFPVGLVACIEGYFRIAIRDLVDAGEPYLSNASKPAASLKLDFSVLRAIHGKSVTIGELVGHSVPLSRIDHIDSSMSVLLGVSFLSKMRVISSRWAHEVQGQPLEPILKDPEKVFSDVGRTFELRHIICHELATAHEVEYDEVARCFEGCVAFLKAADELISETLHPGAPLTQTDMNIASGNSLAEARGALTSAVDGLRRRLSGDDLRAFDESQVGWETYCNAWAEFDAMQVQGGSMWPMLRASSEEALVRARTEELRTYRRMDEPPSGET